MPHRSDADPAPDPSAAAARLAALVGRLGVDAPDVVLRDLDPGDAETVLADRFTSGSAVLTTGLGASPGAAVGRAYLSMEAALDALDRDEAVILVVEETTPADEPVMRVAEGILTARGGLASHAAVVARGFGIPAVCGATDLRFVPGAIVVGDTTVAEGELVSIDGTTGEVGTGERGRTGLDAGAVTSVDRLLEAADVVRCPPGAAADGGRRAIVAVLANADTGDDAARARELGAEGIGLCRTEHMFLGARLPVVQRAILAEGADDEREALAELVVAQQHDFEAVLAAMDGLPVTVRLLDPPLHEFLPSPEAEPSTSAEAVLVAAAREWREVNPMMGTRGVRLALLRPGLYEMQVRALARAVTARRAVGGEPVARIMVPLVSVVGELVTITARIRSVLDEELGAQLPVGTMIETPRAALAASELAPHADFFSFGTNDLTQLVWGFSRDDVEHRLLGRYREDGIVGHSPFARLDPVVASLVRAAIEAARAAVPGLPVGVCGEHGGDPASLASLVSAGIDSTSCSPPRVPVARLAVARALATTAGER